MVYSEIPNSHFPAPSPKAPTPSPSSPPPWARAIDFLCLAITLVGIVIAVSGGFRARIGNTRIALTSPLRLFVWAIVLAVVRHVLAPAAPIYRDLPARIAASWNQRSSRAAAAAFLSTRAAVLLVGYLAVFMVGYRDGSPPWRIEPNELVNLQARWDTGWYFNVAIDGYSYDPALRGDAQQNIVFFPAFPMLMRAAGRLLGGASTAYLLGGTLVSLGAFFWALTYLFRFARDTLGGDEDAASAMWLLAAYPFALFFSAIYSESLYLLAIVAACFHFRRSEFVRAGAWGLLAGLDRAPGCFLSIALALMAIAPWTPAWLYGAPRGPARAPAEKHLLVPALVAAAMPGVGVLLFSAYAWYLTGHPLAWEQGQVAWGRQYTGLSAVVSQRADWIWNGGLYAYTANTGTELLNVLGAVFVIATAWPVARRLGLPYAVLVLINILPPVAAGGFLSTGRFSSVLFPSFVWMGGAIPQRHRTAWVGAFMAMQAFCAVLFYTWRPLF